VDHDQLLHKELFFKKLRVGVEGHFMDQVYVFSHNLEVEKYLSKNEIKSGSILDSVCFDTTYIQCFCFVAHFFVGFCSFCAYT
jgi:hypothetical protein